jgi:hypothetical protein
MRHDGCVKLDWAYVWRCELCGKRHFEEVVIVEPSEAELTDIREHNESMQGDSDGDAVGVISPGDLYRPPYTVRCRSCKVVFAVSNHWDDVE